MKTVAEIAEMFGVTVTGVRYWISKGLPFKTEKVIGIKLRKVINPEDVVKFLGLSKQEAAKYIDKGRG